MAIVGFILSVTVKLFVQVVALLAASFTVMVIVVTPVVTVVPATGDCVITKAPVAEQLSVACTAEVKLGTVALQLAFANAVCAGPQFVIVGAILSNAVKVVVQVVELLEVSLTVIVIVVLPNGTSVPAVGDCVIIKPAEPVQLSEATTVPVKFGTVAIQLAFVKPDCAGEQVVITGAVRSLNNTVKLQLLAFPFLSVTVNVTICVFVAAAMKVPATGLCVTLPALKPHASVAVTLKVRSGNTLVQFAPLVIMVSAKHVIDGAVMSKIVTTAVQLSTLPLASVT